MTQPDFQTELLAELNCLNVALHRLLRVAATTSGAPDNFLRRELEAGLKNIERQQFWGISPEKRGDVVDSASARYSDLITSVSNSLKS